MEKTRRLHTHVEDIKDKDLESLEPALNFRWSLLYVHYNVGYGGLSCDDMRLIIDAERELH
jgi:hypothetical protein